MGSNRKHIFRDTGTYTNFDCDYNDWYDSVSLVFKDGGTTYTTLANWQSGVSQDANSVDSDPSMTDPASADFTLQVGSPCIDAGAYVGLTEDCAGNTVPYGWGVDIGAYEYGYASSLDAEINASPTSGEVPLTVNFTGSATGGTSP